LKNLIYLVIFGLFIYSSVSCKKNNLTVTTLPVSSVGVTSAYIGGNVTSDGGAEVFLRGVCYGIVSSPSLTNAAYTQDGSGLGEFTSKLDGLKANTAYHVRAYAKNTKGIAYGEEIIFTTNPYFSSNIPIIQTNKISNVDTLGLVLSLNGQVLHPGGSEVTESGFVYATKMGPSISDNKIISKDLSVQFTADFTFELGVLYYVNSYAKNSYGVAYGEEIQVKVERAKPTVKTTEVTEIDSTSAVCGGIVTTNGGNPIIAKGMCWSLNPSPTLSDYFSNEGDGTGSFSSLMTGLLPSTIYYCRSYATTSDGTTYGNTFSFKTVVSKLYIGMQYKGGILFYLNPNKVGGGLIVISDDLSASYVWGCVGVNVSGATNTGVGSGLANTEAIVNSCSGQSAAKLCDDLVYGTYSDWYLPSMDELGIMYNNIKVTDLEKFSSGYYWSSNQKDANTAYRYGFLGGNDGEVDKSTKHYVRAIRKFN
jgi:hypothetical protein